MGRISPHAAPSAPRATARVAPHVTVLAAEPDAYLRLDAAGRWTGHADPRRSLRRALDGSVLRIEAGRFRPLGARAAREAHRAARHTLRRFARDARRGRLAVQGDPAALARRLQAAQAWDPARMVAHERALRAAWPEPTPVLPPHRYRDLVVLPAVGCPGGACRFCTLYRGRPFRPLDADAFEAHLQALEDVLGPARRERDGIFLGSASALSLPDDVLLDRLSRLRARWGLPRRGVAAFLDADHAPARDPRSWAALGRAGLTEATLGLETGLEDLRAASGKRGDLRALLAQARAVRAGGLRLGLTVLVGLGGPRREPAHRRATVARIRALSLGPRDLVHLSPRVGGEDAEQARRELPAWRRALACATRARVVPYRLERFAWLA